jgi:transposase-like protein
MAKKTKKQSRWNHLEEFKRAAVARRLAGEGAVAIATDLGVSTGDVHRWVRKYGPALRAALPAASVPAPALSHAERAPSAEARADAFAWLVKVTADLPAGTGNVTPELRFRALEGMFVNPDRSFRDIAAEVGTSETNLYSWRHRYGREVARRLGVPFRPSKRPAPEHVEGPERSQPTLFDEPSPSRQPHAESTLLSRPEPPRSTEITRHPDWYRPPTAESQTRPMNGHGHGQSFSRNFEREYERAPSGPASGSTNMTDQNEIELLRVALRNALRERDAFKTALSVLAKEGPGE